MHNKDSKKLPTIHTDSYALGQLAPLRLFVIIIASIFFAEVIAMLVVHIISPLHYYQTTLLDAGIMVMMIFPILFQFSFRPLIQQIEMLRQTEQRLQQEKELQERFFNSVDIMIAYLDREFNFIRVNDAYARASEGHLPTYFNGKNHFALYPHPENQQIFRRVVETGEAYYAHEKAFEYPDQPERGVTYWNWSVQPVRDGKGNVEGLVLSLVDVTTKRRAEEQLREMALFPTLNPNAALQVEVDGRVRKSNPAAHQIGLGPGICLFEAVADLNGLDLSACIAAGSTLQVDETRLGEQILQWTVRGVSELDLAFFYSNDITARKRSEEAVRLLSSVVEQTADTVVITDPNGVIEYVNPAFEQLTGYSKEEALGGTPRVLKSGIHNAQFYKKLWNTIRSGQAFHSEITNRKRNGALFHEVKAITPLRNGKGEITHFVATGKDITERKQAEQRLREAYDELEIRVQERTEELRIANSELEDEINVRRQAEAALQQSEERLQRAQEIARLGSWELDLLNDQLTWSDEVYRIFGLEPHEFAATYEAFLEAIHPDDRAAVNDAYSSSIRDGKDSYEIEHRVVKWSTGEIRLVHEKCEHFRDETGRIIRSVGMVHDITERKKAEEALRRSEALLLQTGEIAKVGGWELDLQTSTLRWSLETYRIHEVDPSLEPDLTNAINFYTQAVRSTIRTAVEQAIGFGQRYDLELPLITASGKKIWIRTTGQPEFRDDKCVRLFGIYQDITERKQAQEKLQQLNAELEQRVAELQTLMDVAPVGIGIAHDPEVRMITVNRLLSDWVGASEGTNIFRSTPEEERKVRYQVLRKGQPVSTEELPIQSAVRNAQGVRNAEFTILRSDGRIVEVVANAEPLFDEQGCIRGSIATFYDITERKRAEEAVRLANDQLEIRVQQRTEELADANRDLSNEVQERIEVERQLRIQTAAMEAAANGILITDVTGIILWTNPAMSRISGYTYQDMLGQSPRIFSSGRHGPDFYQQMWQAIYSGNVWQGEITNRRKDGGLYIEEQTITPVWNEEGKLSHFIAIKQDITERKLIHAQLEESNRELITLTTSERQQRLLAEGLVESSIVLNMSLELHAVLDHIFEQIRRTIPCLMADIVLIESEIANVVRLWGIENHFETMTIQENDRLQLKDFPIWERMCTTKSPAMISDTDMDNQWNTYFGMKWIHSYLGAPLIYGDEVIGIIDLCSDQANAFQEKMAQNLRAFAASAAVAIQNARLYEEEQQNRRIAETLSAASVALAKTLDIQMVMETILDYVQSILPCDLAFVILSEGDERYRIRTVRGMGEYSAIRDSLQDRMIDLLNEPIVNSYFSKNESTLLSDSRLLSDWNPPLELSSMNCWLGIPLESMGKTIGIVVVANAAPNSFARDQIKLLETVVKQAVVAFQNAWLFEQVRSGRERLQQLSRHLVEIQENERKYIARELHDETSQSLTSLKLGLQLIEQKAAGHKQLLGQVTKLKLLADETLESLHHLAVNLRPASLDHLALADALTGLIESTRQRSGLIAHFKVMGSMQQDALLNEELETSIYRIVQESLTNVVRHARAVHVDVILEWQSDKIVIIIEDDGVGIDMEKARETGHLGLIGMQERAEMLGGKLVVDSTPQVGTTLVVEIPYAHSNTYSR